MSNSLVPPPRPPFQEPNFSRERTAARVVGTLILIAGFAILGFIAGLFAVEQPTPESSLTWAIGGAFLGLLSTLQFMYASRR